MIGRERAVRSRRPMLPSSEAVERRRNLVVSRYRECMTKQTTVRLPDELAGDAETVARVQGTSVNQLIVESLSAEIDRVREDKDFTTRAKRLLARDKELLDRLTR